MKISNNDNNEKLGRVFKKIGRVFVLQHGPCDVFVLQRGPCCPNQLRYKDDKVTDQLYLSKNIPDVSFNFIS